MDSAIKTVPETGDGPNRDAAIVARGYGKANAADTHTGHQH